MRGADLSLRPPGLLPQTDKANERPVGATVMPERAVELDRSGEGVDGPTERAMVGHLKAE